MGRCGWMKIKERWWQRKRSRTRQGGSVQSATNATKTGKITSAIWRISTARYEHPAEMNNLTSFFYSLSVLPTFFPLQTLKKFPCNKCENSFTTTSSLRRHIRDKHKGTNRSFCCLWASSCFSLIVSFTCREPCFYFFFCLFVPAGCAVMVRKRSAAEPC